MATGDELFQRLLKLTKQAPLSASESNQESTTKPKTSFGPSQKATLTYRDSVVNALRNAPSLKDDITRLSQGRTQDPPGALGSIGKLAVNNPLTKGFLGALDTIDKPKRFVISGIREFVDAVDNDAKTKASFKDFKNQIDDPTFGFGRVYAKDGWGGRIVGLIGDLALDPINWLTLGGAIAPKAAIQAGKLVAREVGESFLKESSEELIAGGAQKLGAQIAKDVSKAAKVPTNTRAFLGTKSIAGRSGAAALAEGARKFGATDDQLKAIFKSGRLGLDDTLAQLMGINDYGLRMFGGRVKLPFTGALAKGLASGISMGRNGIVSTKYGEKIFRAFTAGGTFNDINLRDLRFALRSGKDLPAGLTPKMASAILASTTSARASKGIAARQGAEIMRKGLEHPDVVAEADTLYKVLDKETLPTDLTPRQARALAVLEPIRDELYSTIESYGIKVAGGNADDFQIAKWRRNWFPHKMTQAARDFVDNSQSPAAVQARQYMKIDHSNIGGSFESRNLERLVRAGDKEVVWFGKVLTEEDIAGGIDTLNDIARKGGFKGDFFETNIQRAFTSYLENYAEAISTITFYQGLKEAGQDIGSMAVERGMITKEAMESLLDDLTRSEKLTVTKMREAVDEATKGVNLVMQEARSQMQAAQTVAGMTPEQMKFVREGGSALDFTKNVENARLADEVAQKTTLQNLEIAKNNISSKRAELAKAQENFRAKLETDSFALSELDAQHRATITALDNIEARLTNYIEEITTVDEALRPAKEKIAAELKILNNELSVLKDRAEAKVKTLGNHSVEFIDDAMKVIQSYTLGEKYSGVVKDLQELATVGKVLSGDLKTVASRGITGPLGKTQNKLRLSKLLRLQPVLKQAGVELSEAAQLDNAWVELRKTLGILEEEQIPKSTFARLESLTINDVRNTLVRAMSSADPSEIGAVRESITWLMVRSQLDDPTFAKRMLTEPTKEFQSIRVLLEQQRVRLQFGLEAFEQKFTDNILGNVVDYEYLPANLKETAKSLNLYQLRNALDLELQTVSEHLLRVPDVNRSPIYDTVYQVLAHNAPDSVIPQKLYQVLADEIRRANPDAADTMAESFIKILENSATGIEPVITVDELLKQTDDFFPAPAGKNLSNDFRLSAKERDFYLKDETGKPNEFAKKGVGLRTAIIAKQNQLAKARARANDDLFKKVSQLDEQSRKELSMVLNNEEMAKLVGTSLADDSRNLARSAADFYLKEETNYVLKMADQALSAHGVSLTQEGHAQLMNNVYSSFIEAQDKHLVNLYSAENIMKDLAEKTLNAVPAQGGRSQLEGAKRMGVVNLSPSEAAKLTFIENLTEYIKDPKSKEILTAVFPEIILNIGRRQQRLTSEASILANSAKYRSAIEGIADLEIKYFGVGSSADPGGAGLFTFKAGTPPEGALKKVEDARRLRESTLGSVELQKQMMLQRLQTPGRNSKKIAELQKIKKRFDAELADKSKLFYFNGTKTSAEFLSRQFNDDYNAALTNLKIAATNAMDDDKQLKALAVRAGGSKAGQRRAAARKVVRQGKESPRAVSNEVLELAPDSASVKLSQILNSRHSSVSAIKEFFGTILGGDDFATPTVRGSEARRLGGANQSMHVVRREDSFFGKTIPTIQSLRDEVSKRLYSSDPTTSEFIYEKVRYGEYLKQRLTNLEKLVKEKPEAMKLLEKASKELERAEKAAGGLSVEKRLEYIDSLTIAVGDAAPFERVWNPETNDWVIRYTKSTKYKLPPKPKRGAFEADRPTQGPVVDRLAAAEGLSIPAEAFSEVEKQYVRQYLTSLAKYNDFIKSEEYAFAAREYAEKQFKDQLAQYDLSKVEWTVGGDTASVRNWSTSDLKLVNGKVIEQQNYPVTSDDFFVEASQKISNLSNLFTRNKKHLIARMDDQTKPPLIFINQNGQQLPIRLARDVDGSPNGLFEIAEAKAVGMAFDEAPGSQLVGQGDNFEFTIFDPSKTTVSVIDPDIVDDVDPSLKTYKRLRLTENDGQGTVFNPDNVWVRHNPIKDTNKNVLQQDFDNPPYFKRLSEYLPKAIEIPKLKNFDGEDFVFTAIEQEALYTDFNTPTYRGIRGVSGGAYAAEVFKREKAVNELRKVFVESQQDLSRRADVKAVQRQSIEVVREKLDIAVKELEDYVKAAELWDAHFSANRKIAHLYNMFNMGKDSVAGPLTNKRQMLKAGGGSPHNALRNYLKGQAANLKGLDVNVVDDVIKTRKLFVDDQWFKSSNSKIVSRAQELNNDVQTQMQGFGNTDLNVVKNILKAREQINVAGQADGLKADMEREALGRELLAPPSQYGLMNAPIADDTMRNLRTGVESIDRQIQSMLQSRQMVQEVAPGANLKSLIDAQSELDALANDPRAIQARALKSELEWMKGIRGEIKAAAQKELAKKEVLGKGAKGILGIDSIAAAREEAIKTIQKTMAQDPFLMTADEYATTYVPKEMQELVKAQNAFDAASALHTASDVLEAQKKIDFTGTIINRGKGIKKGAGGVKTPEEYNDFRTEYQLFMDEMSSRLRLAANPEMDDKIREQIIKEANAHTEYMRQVASMTEAKRMNAVIQGMTKGAYYAGQPGFQELQEGRLLDESVARSLAGRTTSKGAPMVEWLTHFDDGMVRLGKQFPNIQVAPQIAEFVQNVHRLQEPAVAMELNRFLGKYTRFFKAYATLSPGFHVRNAMSNGFMLFAAGGNARYLAEGLEMSRSLNEASRAGKSVEQWISGLPLEKQERARIAVRASAASGGGDAADRMRNLYMSGRLINNKVTVASKSLGQWIEGHSRFMLAYDGAMQGMDFDTAAARVQRFLIDYEDVSTVDKSLRQIIPFWMWTSRNLPMQVQNIWLNPKAYQAYGNFKRNFMEDKEGQEVIPVWMQEMGAWKLPFGQNLYATPDFGFNRLKSDVNMLQDPARLLSNVNPLLRLPVELMGEKQLFSNKRFSQTPVEVQSFPGTAIQPLMQLLGYGETGPGGQKFVNDKAYYALRNLIPLLSRAESISPSMPTDPSAATSNPLLGLLGAPVREVSQKMQDNELLRRQFELQELLKNYKATNNPQG